MAERLTLNIDPELKKKYHIQALKENKTLTELVLEALEKNYKG